MALVAAQCSYTRTAPTPAGGGVTPFLSETFAWATSSANLRSSAADIANGGNWITGEAQFNTQVSLDTTVGYAPYGLTQSMLVTFPQDAPADYGAWIGFLNLAQTPQNSSSRSTFAEMWIEVVLRFATTFTTAGNKPAGEEYKLMLGGAYWSGSDRWGLPEMQPAQFVLGYPGNNAAFTSSTITPSTLWDGNPHVFRMHLKLSTTGGGILHYTVDGTTILNQSGFTTLSDNTTIQVLRLGANMNRGTAPGSDVKMWWHSVRAYASDPGWGI